MTWQVLITVFTFGGIGAVVRASIIFILAQSASIFPISIILVNTLSCFLGAFIIYMNLPMELNAALVAGLIGGIGTLSAIPGNILDFFFDKAWRRMALYFILTIVLGMLAAHGGQAFGQLVYGKIASRNPTQQSAVELQHMMEKLNNDFSNIHQQMALPIEQENVQNISQESAQESGQETAQEHSHAVASPQEVAPLNSSNSTSSSSSNSTSVEEELMPKTNSINSLNESATSINN